MNYLECVECRPILDACIMTINWVEKTPLSLLQKNYTRFYDVCDKNILSDTFYYDINHWFGSIVILILVLSIFVIWTKIDKK